MSNKFSVYFDRTCMAWVATYKMVGNGTTPAEAVYTLSKFIISGDAAKDFFNKSFLRIVALDKIYAEIGKLEALGDPAIELSFRHGDIGTVNGQLIGMLQTEGKNADASRFILYKDLPEKEEISFSINLFTTRQLANIKIINHVRNYFEYQEKYKEQLQSLGIII